MRERKAYLKVTFPFQSSENDETVDPKYQVFYVDVDTGHGQFKVKKRKIDFDFLLPKQYFLPSNVLLISQSVL